MKSVDIEGLLLPETYSEYEGKELSSRYKTGFGVKTLVGYLVEDIRPALPVKRFTKEECKVLEEKMKKEGKL